MKEYRVYFTARVYDSIVVEAETEDEAEELAEAMTSYLDVLSCDPQWVVEYAEEE